MTLSNYSCDDTHFCDNNEIDFNQNEGFSSTLFIIIIYNVRYHLNVALVPDVSVSNSTNKLRLSCAKLRANLNLSVFVWYVRFSMLGLVCFNWFVWLTCFVWNILFGRFGLVS